MLQYSGEIFPTIAEYLSSVGYDERRKNVYEQQPNFVNRLLIRYPYTLISYRAERNLKTFSYLSILSRATPLLVLGHVSAGFCITLLLVIEVLNDG
jgi:hypothetical protein